MTIDSESNERHPIEILADEFSLRLRKGEHPTIEEYALKHPEFAELIRSIFPSIALVERVAINEDQQRKSNPNLPEATTLNRVPDSLGDYQILREIGRGGMGIVYEAVQRSLNRRVALKVINSLVSGNSQHRARFRREAEAAASLHHTNIVPIYGIGEDQDLQYYAMQLIDGVTLQDVVDCLRHDFVDFKKPTSSETANQIDSSSLSSNIIRTKLPFNTAHAARLMLKSSWTLPNVENESAEIPGAKSSNTRDATPEVATVARSEFAETQTKPHLATEIDVLLLANPTNKWTEKSKQAQLTRGYFRNVARTIANVANAIDYAHHQNILHRDIKPANLLLDREGTIWITDFGLARRTDLDAATQTGEILGTLRYMAPEQIAGHGDSRVDIYSLGLTLFEMLTLRPAIESPKLRLLDPERNSVIPTLRSINPNIPHDLQTITLKACAYAPEHRYQNACEMEADLRRFLEDRPILARQTSRLEMLMRWARRNPAIATLASVAIGMLLVIASLLAVWNRQQQRSLYEIGKQYNRAELNLKEKSEALESVRKEQMRAEMNLELAIKAFDKIMDNIASRGSTFALSSDLGEDETFELNGASLSQADVALLESLLDFFDQFSEQNDKDLRVETATAMQRVGDIQHKIGNVDQAEKSYLKALNSFQTLYKQSPLQSSTLLSQMAIYNELIVLNAKRGQIPKTFGLYQDARRLLEQSPKIASSADGRFALAKLLNSIGTLGARFGREPRMRLGGPLGKAGTFGDSIQLAQAAKLKRESELNAESLSLLNTLANESPENTPYKIVLARALKDEVRIAKLLNDMQRADEAMMRSVEILEGLCASHPDSSAYKYELANTLGNNVGMRTIDMQRAERSLSICEEILIDKPYVPEYLALKASVLVKLSATTQLTTGRSQKAEELLLEAIRIQRDLANRYPDIAGYTLSLGQSLVQLSELEMTLKKPAKAKETIEQAIQMIESLQRLSKGEVILKQMIERLRERKTMIESRQPKKP